MNPQTLKAFKKELLSFYKIFERIANHYNNGHSHGLSSVSVMLQNLCFDGCDTYQYSHDKDVEKCRELIDILRDIKTYERSHFILWACDEAVFSWDGLGMTEFMES